MIGRGQQPPDLFVIERVGKGAPQPGRIDCLRGIGGQKFFAGKEPAKRANRGEVTGETARAQAAFATVQQILRDELALGVVKVFDAAAMEEIGKLGEVGAIGETRVRRKPALHGQMIEKSIDQLFHPTTSFG